MLKPLLASSLLISYAAFASDTDYDSSSTNVAASSYIGLFVQNMGVNEKKTYEEGIESGVLSFGLSATRILHLEKRLDASFTMSPGLVSATDTNNEALKGWMLSIGGELTYHISNTIALSYGLGTNFYNISRPNNSCTICEDKFNENPDLSGASYLTTGVLFNARRNGPIFGIRYHMMKNSDYENHLSFTLLSRL